MYFHLQSELHLTEQYILFTHDMQLLHLMHFQYDESHHITNLCISFLLIVIIQAL